ncbi:glycosyltransferase [Aerococcaceae bacterium DSM 111021]|nr:glycosyltransferase [Aerococcaceae bacterium DSM 111021]
MNSKRRLLVALTIMSSTVYIIWRTVRTLPFEYGWLSIVCGLILLAVEGMGFFEMIVHFHQLSDPLELEEVPEIESEEYPHVDIFISTYNEPAELLFKTINGCLNMEYPDKSKVHIYLCDDGNREEMGVLARELGVTHLVRDTHRHAKAGNLNHAMSVTNSPYIVTFDADMIPRRHFLLHTIPYFVRDESIGFIQTPQTFYNPDLFQYNLYSEKRTPSEQDYFYRDVQVMRNRSNSVIYGGTNTILSRKALEDAGGFFVGVITEDFATGMMIQSKGYQCYAIDEALAVGMAPEDLKSLINQRRRWARGCIQTGRKVNLFKVEGLNLAQKVSYFTSITYWLGPIKQLSYVAAPLLYALMNVIVVRTSFIEVLIFWLPMYLFNNYTLKKLSDNIRNTRLTNIYDMILFPVLLPAVILEMFGVTQTQFKVTRKDSGQKLEGDDWGYKFKVALPHLIFALLSVLGILVSVRQTFVTETPAYIIIIFWLCVNLYNLTMSIFFMTGRKAHRQHERFLAEIDCVIRFNQRIIRTTTYDISEGGLSVQLPFPEWLPPNEVIDIELITPYYYAKFTGTLANVFQTNVEGRDVWRYGLIITPKTLDDKQEFLQIIYDREHSLPKYMVDNYSSTQDWITNLQSRLSKKTMFSRKLPRVSLHQLVRTDQGYYVTLRDFNYQFITIWFDSNQEPPNHLVLHEGGFDIECERVESLATRDSIAYEVTNYEKLVSHELFRTLLASWIRFYEENREESFELESEVKDYIEHSYL